MRLEKAVRRLKRIDRRGGARLTLESLEQRCLLDATPLPAPFGSADVFVQYLRDTALDQYKDLFGSAAPVWGPLPPIYYRDVPLAFQSAALGGPVAGPVTANGFAADYSGTNNQVAGVNEGDIVQTDGKYLYDLSHGQLVIFQTDVGSASPAPPIIVARTDIEGSAVAEFLDGNRVTVISSLYDVGAYAVYNIANFVAPTVSKPKIKVTVFDVADRTAPKVAAATYMDGNYIDARDIGGTVYVAASNSFVGLPAPVANTVNGERFYETKDQYLARVTGHELDLALPHIYKRDAAAGGDFQPTGFVSDPAKILQPIGKDHSTLLAIAVFDTSKNASGPVNNVSVMGAYASTLYASVDHLYLVSPNWESYTTESSSTIYRFDLAGSNVALTAIGKVAGQIGNQFSMDEQGPYFRIVTTTNWGANQSSNLFVLTSENGALKEVGRLTGIAKGEQLHATRFFGDKAFIVTALFVDPLFTVDLSNPAAPKLVGELKIPGFSSYLQMIDETHMLGIGRSDVRGGSLKVSLFDVSDLAHPVEVNNYVIAPTGWNWFWGTGSEAEWDHHAFSYFPEQHTLAVPIYGYYRPFTSIGGASDPDYRSSLWVFNVDPVKGFTVKGTVDHDSQVRRSLRIGDELYSVAEDSVQMHPLNDVGAKAVDVRIVDHPRFVDPLPVSAAVGVPFTGIMQQFHVLSAAGLTATIDWGDGQTSKGTIAPVPGLSERYSVAGTHTYISGGGRSIKIAFARDSEASGTLWNWADIAGPQTSVTLVATPLPTTGGSLFLFTASVAPSPGAVGTVSFLENGIVIPGGDNVPLVDGKAAFSTAALTAGAHSVTAAYSVAPGAAAVSSSVAVTVVSAATPPTVKSVVINGGNPAVSSNQRSRVVDLTINFDQAVQLDANAIQLTLHTKNVSVGGVAQPNGVGAIPSALTLTPSADKKTWQVTFSGRVGVEIGADGITSLKDGVYDCTIDGAKVHPIGAPGTSMAVNSTTTFYRLFGDTNSPATPTGGAVGADFEAVLNAADNLAFRNAFNTLGGGNYQAAFDFDGNGVINTADNLQFRSRFNKPMSWRA